MRTSGYGENSVGCRGAPPAVEKQVGWGEKFGHKVQDSGQGEEAVG